MSRQTDHIRPTCVGCGLVALDVITSRANPPADAPASIDLGGSCGNVLAILAAMGWTCRPLIRLGDDGVSAVIAKELHRLQIQSDLVIRTTEETGTVIFHYIRGDGSGRHRFDFHHPITGKRLSGYRAPTLEHLDALTPRLPHADVWYCDRISPASVRLAEHYAKSGALIFVEPQRVSAEDLKRILPYADVIKAAEGNLPSDQIRSHKRVVVIETLGASGVRFRVTGTRQKRWHEVPAIPATHLVDTAGAGDWMSAYLIARAHGNLLHGDVEQIETALREARVVSLLSILFPGARGVMRHLDVDAIIAIARGPDSTEAVHAITSRSRPPPPSQRLRDVLNLLSI